MGSYRGTVPSCDGIVCGVNLIFRLAVKTELPGTYEMHVPH